MVFELLWLLWFSSIGTTLEVHIPFRREATTVAAEGGYLYTESNSHRKFSLSGCLLGVTFVITLSGYKIVSNLQFIVVSMMIDCILGLEFHYLVGDFDFGRVVLNHGWFGFDIHSVSDNLRWLLLQWTSYEFERWHITSRLMEWLIRASV